MIRDDSAERSGVMSRETSKVLNRSLDRNLDRNLTRDNSQAQSFNPYQNNLLVSPREIQGSRYSKGNMTSRPSLVKNSSNSGQANGKNNLEMDIAYNKMSHEQRSQLTKIFEGDF